MIRTYKRKLILNQAQEQRIRSWIGASRLVYNMGLEIRIASYRNLGKYVHKYELMSQLKDIRTIDWMGDVSSGVLKNVIERLDVAYKSFFNGKGFPKFASKKTFKSINFKTVKIASEGIILPKIGEVKIFNDSEIIGRPKTAQVILEPTGFFITIQCEDVPKKFNSDSQAIGLDMGISHFCISSNGHFIENPRYFLNHERKLRIENRSLSRKKRGSNGWKRQSKRLNLLHHKIGNLRKDFLHKESTKIAKSCEVVYMEDLKVASMAKNKNLSKHILDAGWGMFRSMLSYKTKVVLVDPKYTSQRCNNCGCTDSVNRISQSEFKCKECGHTANADHNAALNILGRGTALSR